MKQFDIAAAALVIVAALNWGLTAIAPFDLVAALVGLRFGEISPPRNTAYGLVAVAAAHQALFWNRVQLHWAHPANLSER